MSIAEQGERFLNEVFPKTRSQGERKASVTTLYRTIKSTDSMAITRAGSDEEFIPIHVVNYNYKDGKDAGFVVMTDDERVDEQIFVYNNEGHWSADSSNTFTELFFNQLDGYLEHSVTQNRIAERPLCRKIKEQIGYESDAHECRSGVKWGQGDPYNALFPTCKKCSNTSSTGCVTTAVAHIMAYHEKPTTGNYHDSKTNTTINQTYDWPEMKASYFADVLAPYHKYMVSHLMITIGKETIEKFKCNNHDGSGSTLGKAHDCLAKMGYTNFTRTYKFDPGLIKASLKNNRPVIMRGEKSGSNTGHEWTIEGYKYFYDHHIAGEQCEGSAPNTKHYITETYDFYFNTGWGGDKNGYYRNVYTYMDTSNYPNWEYNLAIETLTGMY